MDIVIARPVTFVELKPETPLRLPAHCITVLLDIYLLHATDKICDNQYKVPSRAQRRSEMKANRARCICAFSSPHARLMQVNTLGHQYSKLLDLWRQDQIRSLICCQQYSSEDDPSELREWLQVLCFHHIYQSLHHQVP